MTAPLHGLRVLDFTTLLPGPLATLLLAEAGATVLKVEPPGGDPVRRQGPFDASGTSVPFQLLNRGKHLRTLDLKQPAARQEARELAQSADVLVEQFRPGVMDRLELGAGSLQALNPRLVYCSITGYGRHGPDAARAGHDLNYQSERGLLVNTAGTDAAPVLPGAQLADIGGGSWPAVMNILLALIGRSRDGRGSRIEIAMAENLWPFQLLPLARYWAAGEPCAPGDGWLSGGLARYQLYRTRDGRWLAVGALEDRFFERFLELVGVSRGTTSEADLRAAIAANIGADTADGWLRRLAGEEVCVSLVRNLEESLDATPVAAARAFRQRSGDLPPLPLPLDPSLRSTPHRHAQALPSDGWPAA
ncbi:MAG: CoA transferase [Proteobacteria bacterium]|nr:CoA transferase [Pseudomonadota bacterium]